MSTTQRSIVPKSAFPADEAFEVNAAYLLDASADKVNLGIGVYREDNGQPWPLTAVEQAEALLRQQQNLGRHEYLPLQGDVRFLAASRDLAFCLDPTSADYEEKRARIASAQTISGTGANHIGAVYLKSILNPARVWLPDVGWSNHFTIWALSGASVETYPYYDAEKRACNIQATIEALESRASAGDVVLLHACAHNPTGCDPTKEEWRALAQLCDRKNLVPFFDMAYQGFASGDVVEDAWAITHFFNDYPNMEFLVAQSFSKNFGLYGQRAGALHVVVKPHATPDVGVKIVSNLCNLIRGEFSMAPRAGSDIVRTVLEDQELTKQWHQDLETMSGRIRAMRTMLYDALVALRTPGDWTHILAQNGMFTYTGLSTEQVRRLREEYHIYMLSSGRISIAGLSTRNVLYVAQAIHQVVSR